jgi:hypothetical protein
MYYLKLHHILEGTLSGPGCIAVIFVVCYGPWPVLLMCNPQGRPMPQQLINRSMMMNIKLSFPRAPIVIYLDDDVFDDCLS